MSSGWMRVSSWIVLCASAWAQNDVVISPKPPKDAIQAVYVYSGANLVAKCLSPSFLTKRLNTQVSISSATNANPVVFTANGHGMAPGLRPVVQISGGTGSWSAVNGQWVATVLDANTFSIPVNSASFGAVSGSLTFATTAPRSGVKEWAVQVYSYDSGNNLINSGWLGGSSGFVNACSDYNNSSVASQ